MKNNILIASLLLAGAILPLTSCNGKTEPKDGGPLTADRLALDFYPYRYTAVVEDTVEGSHESINVEGWGVLPRVINKNDITELRDSLMKLGMVSEINGSYSLAPTSGVVVKLTEGKAQTESRTSVVMNVSHMSPNIITWKQTYDNYMQGAAHGIRSTAYINYDVVGNKILTYSNLFKPGFESTLKVLLASRLQEMPMIECDLQNVPIPQQYYVGDGGLTFVYGVYEVAPYSMGEIEIFLDFPDLGEILSDYAAELFGAKE